MIKGPTIYLKTDTITLPRVVINKITRETIKYCIATLGTLESLPVPKVSVVKRVRSRRYGQYDFINNKIEIHYNTCGTVELMIRTIIHEYTHYIQDVKKNYNKLLYKYGYEKHPQEIGARKNENLYSPCWKQIKSII